MPLYKTDALILRTYKLGEADRIVVFLTRDRGKKRGVASGARRPKSRFAGALEPLTRVGVSLLRAGTPGPRPAQLRGVAVFAAARVAARCAQPRRLLRRADRRVGAGGGPERAAVPPGDVDARGAGRRRADRRRWPGTSSTWLLRLQGVYPPHVACHRCGTALDGELDGACLEPGAHVFTCHGCSGRDGRGRAGRHALARGAVVPGRGRIGAPAAAGGRAARRARRSRAGGDSPGADAPAPGEGTAVDAGPARPAPVAGPWMMA